MARILLAFVAVIGFGTGAMPSEAGKPGEPIVTYTLDNGLEVVLAPDHRAPKVVMNVRYSVGSMNEPAGRSGFAHLFEHLMFSGTRAWPDPDSAHAAEGNDINAWTMEDGTVYYVEGMSSSLPMILSLEADRMANLGGNVDQRELDLQRSVVKNEMRQNVLDRAGGSGWEAFWSGLFPKPHPYSRTVIGSMADLDSATLDDVRGFFNTYYVPNNATLILTGDFDIADAKSLIAQTFGIVPRGEEVQRPSAIDPKPAKFRLDLRDRVPSPVITIGYAGPAGDAPGNGALSIAAELLGNGEIGALRTRLVSEKGLATYASASWTPGLLGGRFSVEAGAAAGVAAEALEAELAEAVSDFVSTPLDPTDVERARRSLLLADRLDTESLKDRADSLGFQTDMYGKISYGFGDDPDVVNATTADVEAAMRRVLDPDAAGVLVLRPGPRGGYPAVLTESSGVPAAFAAKDRGFVAVPKLASRQPATASLPAMETTKLSNGIRLVHYTMPSAPVAYVAASATAGWNSAPQGKEGLLSMAASMANRGAGDRSQDAFAKAAQDIGATFGYEADSLATTITLSIPADAFDSGVSLLSDAILKPRFDAAEWSIAKAETLDWLAGREADLPGLADRAASRALFPQMPGKAGPDWTEAAVRSITREEARDAFVKLFKPATTTFYSVGAMPMEAVAAGLEKAFGGWKDSRPGYPAETLQPATFAAGRTVLLLPEPGASQSALYVVRPAPGVDEAQRSESTAVARLLGGDFNSRLNSVIREEKGYSYGVDSYLLGGVRFGSGLVVATTVERDTTGPALSEIVKGFGEMVTIPVTSEEVNRTVTIYRQTLAGEAETSAGLFEDLLSAVGEGSTLEHLHAAREEKTRLKLDAVAAQAVALASLDPVLVVVAGDPDAVLPQLAAIGLGDIRLLQRDTVQPTAAPAVGQADSDDAAPDRTIPGINPRAEILRNARDGRSTRTINCPDTGGGQDCGADAHQD